MPLPLSKSIILFRHQYDDVYFSSLVYYARHDAAMRCCRYFTPDAAIFSSAYVYACLAMLRFADARFSSARRRFTEMPPPSLLSRRCFFISFCLFQRLQRAAVFSFSSAIQACWHTRFTPLRVICDFSSTASEISVRR